ncbi:MAG: TolC family protein [Burkholderiaceae bacterium]|nr:TolC family protein [Burkholderiaceae bacterium]
MTTRPWVNPGAGRLVSNLALIAAAWAAALTPLSARAQSSAEASLLTLPQAFAAAWPRQPEARSAVARRQAADAQASAARSWTAEPMALELSAKSDRLNGNHGAREYEVGIAAPLWLPGERGGAQALAQAERVVVDSRIDAARWRLAGSVREAWWAAQRAALETALAEARQANASQLAGDVARRVKAGDLSRADQHQADGAVAAAQSALAEAQAAQAQAQQALRSITGVAPALAVPVRAEPPPSDASRAGADHPALRELETRAELARRARGLASLQTRANPELTLSAARDRGAFGDAYAQTLTLGLRIPFGSVDRQRARQASAGAEQAEAESLLELERGRVAADIATAQFRADAAQRVVVAADQRAALADETKRLFEKSFRLGETDLPTRLRVELEAFEAERQRERARIDLAQAVSQWRQALGLLPE